MWSTMLVVRSMVHATRRSGMRACSQFHDPLEHATGPERAELEAALEGNCDPFYILPIKRGLGTKDKPNYIPSVNPMRLMGCICKPDAFKVNFMWLHEGEPKRCFCGYWFVLTKVKPLMDNPPH